MSRRALAPVLALVMLVPPGTCTCQAHSHSDPDPAAVWTPDGEADHGPAPCPDAPQRDGPCDRDHDPFCPAAGSAAPLAAVREAPATPRLPPAPALATPAVDPPTGPVVRAGLPPRRPGEPPPLYLRLCALLL